MWSWFEDWARFSGEDDDIDYTYAYDDDTNADDYMTDQWLVDRIRNTDISIINDSALRQHARTYIDSLVWATTLGEDFESADGEYAVDIYKNFAAAINATIQPFADQAVLAETYNKEMKRLAALADIPMKNFDQENGDVVGQMLRLMQTPADFDTQCSLLLLWADHEDLMRAPEWWTTAAIRVLQSGHYSPLLFDIWQRWRAMYQYLYNGSSTWSDIPNNYYNTIRLQCFLTCLNYIKSHPDDIMAMNCASLLAGTDNIQRFGFALGNSAIIDIDSLMPNAFGIDEEDEEDYEGDYEEEEE